jgi:hypothetical protein
MSFSGAASLLRFEDPHLFAAIVLLIATELRSFDDLRDDRCLGICIVLNILPFLLSQSQLRPGIQLSVAGIPAQPISKKPHAVNFRAAIREYVEINLGARLS